MASDCYGASEESRVRGTWSRKENTAPTAPRYLLHAEHGQQQIKHLKRNAASLGYEVIRYRPRRN
jgi:hypothetical protein